MHIILIIYIYFLLLYRQLQDTGLPKLFLSLHCCLITKVSFLLKSEIRKSAVHSKYCVLNIYCWMDLVFGSLFCQATVNSTLHLHKVILNNYMELVWSILVPFKVRTIKYLCINIYLYTWTLGETLSNDFGPHSEEKFAL